jgi:hypothetical protein
LTGGLAGSMNNMFGNALGQMASPEGMKSLGNIINNIVTAFQRLEPAVAPFVSALTKIVETGSGFLPGFSDAITNAAIAFNNFITKAQEDGSLQNFIQKGIDALVFLKDLFVEIGKRIFDTFGNRSVEDFDNTLRTVADSVMSIISAITKLADFVNDIIGPVEAVAKAIGGWERVIWIAAGAFAGFKLVGLGAATALASAFTGAGATAATGFAGKLSTGLMAFGWAGVGAAIAVPILSAMDNKINDFLKSKTGQSWKVDDILKRLTDDPNTPSIVSPGPPPGQQPVYTNAPPLNPGLGKNLVTGAPPGAPAGKPGWFGNVPLPPGAPPYSPHAVPPVPGKEVNAGDRRNELENQLARDPRFNVDPFGNLPGIPSLTPGISPGTGPEGPEIGTPVGTPANGMPQVYYRQQNPYEPGEYGIYKPADPKKVTGDTEEVKQAAREWGDAQRNTAIVEQLRKENLATEVDLIQAQQARDDKQEAFVKARQKLVQDEKGTWDKINEGTQKSADKLNLVEQQIGAKIDKDFGFSKGLPGVLENLFKVVANLAMAPVIGALTGVTNVYGTAGPGSGLLGLLAPRKNMFGDLPGITGALPEGMVLGPDGYGIKADSKEAQSLSSAGPGPVSPPRLPGSVASNLSSSPLTASSGKEQVAAAIIAEAQRRGFNAEQTKAVLSTALQESGLNPTSKGGGGAWHGIFQQDTSYPGRDDPNTNISEFFNRLGAPTNDIWGQIFALQQGQPYATGRKAYMSEIQSQLGNATSLYSQVAGSGGGVPSAMPGLPAGSTAGLPDPHGGHPQVSYLAALAERFGLKLIAGKNDHVNDGLNHPKGLAGDFSSTGNAGNSPQQAAFAQFLHDNLGGFLNEEIYSDPNAPGVGLSMGQPHQFDAGTLADHRGHIHASVSDANAPAFEQAVQAILGGGSLPMTAGDTPYSSSLGGGIPIPLPVTIVGMGGGLPGFAGTAGLPGLGGGVGLPGLPGMGAPGVPPIGAPGLGPLPGPAGDAGGPPPPMPPGASHAGGPPSLGPGAGGSPTPPMPPIVPIGPSPSGAAAVPGGRAAYGHESDAVAPAPGAPTSFTPGSPAPTPGSPTSFMPGSPAPTPGATGSPPPPGTPGAPPGPIGPAAVPGATPFGLGPTGTSSTPEMGRQYGEGKPSQEGFGISGGGLIGVGYAAIDSAIQGALAAAGTGGGGFAPGAGGIEAAGPMISAAAQIGIDEINRAIEFGGKAVGIGVEGMMETFLPVESELADPARGWAGRLLGGLAGVSSQLPNIAGGLTQSLAGNGQGQPPLTPEQVAAQKAQDNLGGKGGQSAPGQPPINVNVDNSKVPDIQTDVNAHQQQQHAMPGQR